MATLTPTLTLASSDMNGDTLNLSVTDTLTVLGQVTTKQVVASTTPTVIAQSANYSKAYVYLKNHSTITSEIITIENQATFSANITNSDATITAVAGTGSGILPAMRFGAAVSDGTIGVSAPGIIPAGTTVGVQTNATVFEMSANATGALAGSAGALVTVATDEYFKLGPGEFAFFPWIAGSAVATSRIDLACTAAAGAPVLEVRVYQEAAA